VGIPNFYGFGSGLVGGERVRFLVLSRLGADIQKFFQSGDRPLPLATALNIAIQIIDSLGNANNNRSLDNIIVLSLQDVTTSLHLQGLYKIMQNTTQSRSGPDYQLLNGFSLRMGVLPFSLPLPQSTWIQIPTVSSILLFKLCSLLTFLPYVKMLDLETRVADPH
jgi:hypothetical protein